MMGRRWYARLSVTLIALAYLLQATAAFGAEEFLVEIASLDADEPGDVVAVVSVADSSGRPVLGLTDENFTARIEGSPIAIGDVTPAVNSDIGVAVVLAVDVSGSMEGEPLVQARAAARTFVEGLAPIDSVALVTFGDDAVPVLVFTADGDAVFAALDTLQTAGGDTALYQATSVSAYVAASAQTQRKAVVLLSDGVDFGNRSAVSREESLAHATAVGVPFFAVGLGKDIDGAYLEALAQGTGGQFLETPTSQGLSDLFRAIGDSLRSQYVVTLRPGSLDREQPLTLELEVTFGEASGVGREALPALQAPVTAEPPTVTVRGLVSGTKVDAPVSVSAQVTGESPLKTVRITVDGTLLTELTSPPYEVRLDPAAYALGSHVLRVEAIDTAGGVGATELSFVAAAPAGGGPSTGLLTVGAAFLLLAAAGTVGLLAIVRRRPDEGALNTRVHPWSPRRHQEPEPWQPPAGELPTMSDEPLGRLVVAAGPRQGESIEVGACPLRLGSAPHCDLVLADEAQSTASEEARVWVSEGRLMFHKLTRLTSFASEGATGGWFILQDGDEIDVGSHRLVFELLVKEDSITEALRQLERKSSAEPEGETEEKAIPQTAGRVWEADLRARDPAPPEEADSDFADD